MSLPAGPPSTSRGGRGSLSRERVANRTLSPEEDVRKKNKGPTRLAVFLWNQAESSGGSSRKICRGYY